MSVIIVFIQDDQFHCFCRPVLQPILSDFCRRLTGISQVCELASCIGIAGVKWCNDVYRLKQTKATALLKLWVNLTSGWKLMSWDQSTSLPLLLTGIFPITIPSIHTSVYITMYCCIPAPGTSRSACSLSVSLPRCPSHHMRQSGLTSGKCSLLFTACVVGTSRACWRAWDWYLRGVSIAALTIPKTL